jgi:small subunit ribosomal protein S4
MSLDSVNCFNITAQPGIIDDRGLNLFQSRWKSKALCRLYFNGDVSEGHFKKTFNENNRNIFRTIEAMETRLDNALFRVHFAHSVFHARKMITEGKVLVNGTKSFYSSKMLRPGDLIQMDRPCWDEVAKIADNPYLKIWAYIPRYFEVNYSVLAAVLVSHPKFEDVPSPYAKEMVEKMGAYYQKFS